MRRLLLLPLLLVGCPDEAAPVISSEACEACDGECVVENVELQTATHTEDPIDYDTTPPVGGPHDPCWADWGVYDTELDSRHWIHNLEHGGIVYLYDCPDGCAEDVAVLEAIEAAAPSGTVIVTPYSGLDGGFAAVSWGWRMLTGCADQAALQQFYDDRVDQAPESVTSDAPAGCSE